MKFSTVGNEIFPLIEVELGKNESIMLERGAMVYHNEVIELTAEKNANGSKGVGGSLKALGRSVTSGESYYISKATSKGENGKIGLASTLPGKTRELQIGFEQWRLNTGVYLASEMSVSYTMQKQKVSNAFFGGTGGFYVMETQGEGLMFICSYGDMIELTLDGESPLTIDNEHVIAWTTGLDYEIKVASGMFGFKTGEGLVNEFRGKGTVLIQTRNLHSLAESLQSISQTSK